MPTAPPALRALVLLSLLFVSPPPRAAAAPGLLTRTEEAKIGRKVVEEVKGSSHILEDPYLDEYFDEMGRRLAAARGPGAFEPDVHVVADSRINAFAVPGGHIFVTSQAILVCEDESELAGVVAHEMGHGDGRHIAHRIESSSKLNLATLAAVLAGAFLTRNAEAGAAIATFAMAGAQTKMLEYSRTDEQDADRRAVRLLGPAGYDGWGLVRFMETIRKQSPAPEGVPAYLFTHPLPEDRVAYLSEILPQAAQLAKPGNQGRLWRLQARVLAQDPRPWGVSFLTARAEQNPESADARLGQALLLKASGRYDEAEKALAEARRLAPADAEVRHEQASLLLRRGRAVEAVADLEALRSEGAASNPALTELGWAYLEANDGAKALGVYEELASRLEKAGSTGAARRLGYFRGMALGKAGRDGEAHAALGDYYLESGEPRLAERHYREALRTLAPGVLRDRVETALKDVPRRDE